MYFHYFVIILPLEKEMALHLKKFEFPSPQDALFKFGWNWLSGPGEDENKKS